MKIFTLFLAAQLTAGTTYHRETIDSLWKSKNINVIITGEVAALSLDDQKRITFRIGDEHGHFVSCILAKNSSQPLLGIKFNIYGSLKKYSVPERGQGVMEINVDKIEPVEK